MLSILGVYIYRDMWPLATYTHQPKDLHEGYLLWLKIICSLVSGVVIPLITPRVPQILSRGLEKELPKETTASWMSLLTYSYLDSLIFHSEISQLSGPEDFPEIPSSDRTSRIIQRTFPYLSRWHGAPERHVAWSILALFKIEFCTLAGLLSIKALSNFAAPVAINRLLEHMEHGEGAAGGSVLRPWVWVALLFLGPLVGTIAFQAYGYYSVGPRAEAMLIQLVFDHALRIRLTGDGSSEEEHSHFVGRLNNLITTDLMSIIDGRDFLILSKAFLRSCASALINVSVLYTPLEFGLAMWFLHHFLGWSYVLLSLIKPGLKSPQCICWAWGNGHVAAALKLSSQKGTGCTARVFTEDGCTGARDHGEWVSAIMSRTTGLKICTSLDYCDVYQAHGMEEQDERADRRIERGGAHAVVPSKDHRVGLDQYEVSA